MNLGNKSQETGARRGVPGDSLLVVEWAISG